MLVVNKPSVHLWWMDGRKVTPSAAWVDTLSEAEQYDVQRKIAPLRQRSLVAKVFVKSVLAQYVNKTPLELRFKHNAYGKPSLVDEEVSFNVSHSAHYAALAVAVSGQIGIDLQVLSSTREPLAIAARFFHPSEYQWLQALPSVWQSLYFYRLWAAKEAVLKAAGIGIGATGLKDIVFAKPIDVTDASPLQIHHDYSAAHLATLHVQEYFWFKDAAMSLATCQSHIDLQTFVWQGKLAA